MSETLQAVSMKEKLDGSWQALHEPSGRVTHGLSKDEAENAMRDLLGVDEEGQFGEPKTSPRFEGIGHDIATHLEGPVSQMLALHSGFARLEAYQDAIATIRLGGGCEGCPSSRITLMNGVKRDLQDKFGEEVVIDVFPILD